MAEQSEKTYKAFLSYSHADTETAAWFHRKLENWRIDRDLIGTETDVGPVPASLRPIFRDRDDFAGGHSLAEATVAVLEASEFLVVLCSPNSAKSQYVNEEVRLFKALGRSDRVIPVIIAGEPGDEEDECFPPAVKFKVGNTGKITKTLAEPVAPDAREIGDGRQRAAAKVVAGLLGIRFDDIVQRARRAERRRKLQMALAGVGVAAITAVGGYYYWQSQQLTAQHELSEQENAKLKKLVDTLLASSTQARERVLPGERNRAAPDGQRELLTDALKSAQRQANQGDQRMAQALDLLGAGKVEEAEKLFRAVAEEKAQFIDKSTADAAKAFRNLGAISRLSDPPRAKEAFAKSLQYEPDDPDALFWYGILSVRDGSAGEAKTALSRLIEASEPLSRHMFLAHSGLAELHASMLNIKASDQHAQQALEVAELRMRGGHDDMERVFDVSRAYSLKAAAATSNSDRLKWTTQAVDGLRQVLTAEPENALAWMEMATNLAAIAETHFRLGNDAEGRKAARAALDFVEHPVQAKDRQPATSSNQSVEFTRAVVFLGVALSRPDQLTSNADRVIQRELLARTRTILTPFLNRDPTNAWIRSVLFLSHLGSAVSLAAENGTAERVSEHFREAREIFEQVVRDKPEFTVGLHLLLGGCMGEFAYQVELGRADAAENTLDFCLEVADKAESDPSPTLGWSEPLISVHLFKGKALLEENRPKQALESLEKALAAATRQTQTSPAASGTDGLLWSIYDYQTATYVLLSRPREALDAAGAGLALAYKNAQSNSNDLEWGNRLSESRHQVRTLSNDNIGRAEHMFATGELHMALQVYRENLASLEAIAANGVAVVVLGTELTGTQFGIGVLQQALGKFEEALRAYEAQLTISKKLALEQPDSAHWPKLATSAYFKIAEAHYSLGQSTEALENFSFCVKVAESEASLRGGEEWWLKQLFACQRGIGDIHRDRNMLPSAEKFYQRSLSTIARLAELPSTYEPAVAAVHVEIARIQLRLKNYEDAQTSIQSAQAIIEKHAASNPSNAMVQNDLATVFYHKGSIDLAFGRFDRAFAAYRASETILKKLVAKEPDKFIWKQRLALTPSWFAWVHANRREAEKARQMFEACRSALLALLEQYPGQDELRANLASLERVVAEWEATLTDDTPTDPTQP